MPSNLIEDNPEYLVMIIIALITRMGGEPVVITSAEAKEAVQKGIELHTADDKRSMTVSVLTNPDAEEVEPFAGIDYASNTPRRGKLN